MEIHLGAWEPFQNEWHRFGLQLMGLGLVRGTPLLRQLRGYFDEAGRDWSNLLELIATSWVDGRSAGIVKDRDRPIRRLTRPHHGVS